MPAAFLRLLSKGKRLEARVVAEKINIEHWETNLKNKEIGVMQDIHPRMRQIMVRFKLANLWFF